MADYHTGAPPNLFNFGQRQPLGANPFPPDHSAHQLFEQANWETEREIALLAGHLFNAPAETPDKQFDAALTYAFAHAELSAAHALKVVSDEETARWYEDWLERCFQLEFNQMLSWIDALANANLEGFTKPVDQNDLQVAMMGKLSDFRAASASIVAHEIEKRRVSHRSAGIRSSSHRRRGRPARSDEEKRDIETIGENLTRLKPKGLTYGTIAQRINASEDTVEKHFQGTHGQWEQVPKYATELNVSIEEILKGTISWKATDLRKRSRSSIENKN